MANDGEVRVGIKVVAEGDGAAKVQQDLRKTGEAGVQTQAQFEQLGKRAKDLGRNGKESFDVMGKAANGFRKVMGALGIATFVTGILAGLGKIADSFKHAEKNAEDLAKVNQKLAEDTGLQDMAADVARLSDALANATAAENRMLGAIDEEVQARRRLEKAKLEAAKTDEIAKLDMSAEDYGERRAAIEAKYGKLAAGEAASNAMEDVQLSRQKIASQIGLNDKALAAEDANAAYIRRRIADAERAKSAADMGSQIVNEFDKSSGVDAVSKTLGQIFTLDWGRVGGATTAEGDAERKRQAEESARLTLELQKLNEELRRSDEKRENIRAEGDSLRRRFDASGQLLDAATIEGETGRRSADLQAASANKALWDKNDAIAKRQDERQTALNAVLTGRANLADLERQRIELEGRKAHVGDAYEQAGYAAAQANYKGNEKEYARLTAVANKAGYEMKQADNELDKALKLILDAIAKQKSDIQKNESRAKALADES